ncbi:hypothetical protein [Pseudomonas sp. S9]|uniref:hypothetical protein n=1 Tax=Pseudomonas sp. S9 TaxID=686578 RepID=UPI0002557659|nr:hypothetical protein [Pseudomonas sp. S9]
MQNLIADQCPLAKRNADNARRAAKLELNKIKSEMKTMVDVVTLKAGLCPSILLALNNGDLKVKTPNLSWVVGSNLPTSNGKWPQSFRRLHSLQDYYNPEKHFIKNSETTAILEELFNNVEELNKQAKAAFKVDRMLRPKGRNSK